MKNSRYTEEECPGGEGIDDTPWSLPLLQSPVKAVRMQAEAGSRE